MATPLPLTRLVGMLGLPARHFAVVDAGQQRARILFASVGRGRPRRVTIETIDTHGEGFTTQEELYEEVRQRLRVAKPEAVVLVVPHHQILRHVLEVPPGDADATRAHVEREASSIGGLSESPWVFDAVRLRPFGGSQNPIAAAFCRQDHLQTQLSSFAEDERQIFDVLPAGDALAAAFAEGEPEVENAVLVDLGAQHTGIVIWLDGQAVYATSIPTGSAAFTDALAADHGWTAEAAEVLKRSEPPALTVDSAPKYRAAVMAWLGHVERTLREWQAEHVGVVDISSFPVYMAGGGALQPGLVEGLSRLAKRPFRPWPARGSPSPERADAAVAWGALLLAADPVRRGPSLLPPPIRARWNQQRLWRALVIFNLVLAGVLALAIGAASLHQARLLREKAAWIARANRAVQQAEDIRSVAEGFNARLDEFRPILERQRQTVETLQVMAALQRQRTNDQYWYVLLADAASYSAGSNHFASTASPRGAEGRAPSTAVTNTPPPSSRVFIAEVCFVPQGEAMRQMLSDLVADLKSYPVFRNVDVLPAESRRELVSTNLIFPERHLALELNLSEAALLPAINLPRVAVTNLEPRGPFRSGRRAEHGPATNSFRAPFSR